MPGGTIPAYMKTINGSEFKPLSISIFYFGPCHWIFSYNFSCICRQQLASLADMHGGTQVHSSKPFILFWLRLMCISTNEQGCALTAPGHLRRLKLDFGRLKKNSGCLTGHSSALQSSCEVKRIHER